MNTNTKCILFFVMLLLVAFSCQLKEEQTKERLPNIIYILADDLGYGDVSIYNQGSKISTPNIDNLARQGMRFTDAHSPSSVCTPTRYGILTGRYCWRSKLPRGVLQGYGQSLIEHEETTVAELLKNQGYTTGVVGKWHLGLDWIFKENHADSLKKMGDRPIYTNMKSGWIDFTLPPENGPTTHGFDYSYILPASLDMEPYCYLENDVLTELPDAYTEGNDLNTPVYATEAFWRAGRMSKSFDFYEVLPTFISKAKSFVKKHANDEKPFFLYLPLAAPHTPWVPKDDYKGSSKAGQYGDFVQMVDAAVGDFLKDLDDQGLTDNTLLIFTSDNGPYWRPEYIERFGHHAADKFRGMKADIWDGGHRIPFIVRWPGNVVAGSKSDQLTTLTNLISTVANVTKSSLKDGEGIDSRSILPVLLGAQSDNNHPVVHHSSKGMFSVREGDWKYIDGLGSGGFSKPVIIVAEAGQPNGQLFNMNDDPSEKNDLSSSMPETVEEMKIKLNRIKGLN